MNSWGRAGIVLFFGIWTLLIGADIILISAGAKPEVLVFSLIKFGIQGAFVAWFNSLLKRGSITNGTFFVNAILGPIAGGIAHLINGNPNKKAAKEA